MNEILQALILGIVQGLTELLPISSSAHLNLIPWVFNWSEISPSFDVALHFGTLLAIVIFFFKDWIGLIKGGYKQVVKKEKKYTKEEALDMAINKALENVEKKLNEKDEIIDKKVLKKNINDSKMDIDVFVVVKKIISTQEEITVEKGID